MNYRPKLRDALMVVGLIALVGAVVIVHTAPAAALASISSEARAFATDDRAAVAALDGPRTAAEPAVASALRAGRHFETSLDAYPVRWVDRVAYEPMFWLVLLAGLGLSALALSHAAVWAFGIADTWAQRDRRRIHARLFWSALLTDGFVACCSSSSSRLTRSTTVRQWLL